MNLYLNVDSYLIYHEVHKGTNNQNITKKNT